MADSHKIMYVGLQMVPSADRPNNRPDRVWHGPGDVVSGIPPIQAANLLAHKDEWADVTHLSAQDLLKAQQAARTESEERLRAMKNPIDAPNNKRSMDSATDDELLEELQRRKLARGQIAAGKTVPKATPIETKPQPPVATADQSQKAILGAIEAIMSRIHENSDLAGSLLDDTGMPTFAAVQEQVGYPIQEAEYKAALGIDEAAA